jgi:hypothetical protein
MRILRTPSLRPSTRNAWKGCCSSWASPMPSSLRSSFEEGVLECMYEVQAPAHIEVQGLCVEADEPFSAQVYSATQPTS